MLDDLLLLLLHSLDSTAQMNELVNKNRIQLVGRLQNLRFHAALFEGAVLVNSGCRGEGVACTEAIGTEAFSHGCVSCSRYG